jgi:hypothetical protein
MITLGSPISQGLASYFGVRKSLAAAAAADQDVRAHASRIADLALGVRAELVGAMNDLAAFKRIIGQGRLF